MSAVSKKLTPASSAARTTVSVALASSRGPKLLHPRPTTDTSSAPIRRWFMTRSDGRRCSGGGGRCRVGVVGSGGLRCRALPIRFTQPLDERHGELGGEIVQRTHDGAPRARRAVACRVAGGRCGGLGRGL